MYSVNGNGKRRIASELLRKVKSSRKVSSGLKAMDMVAAPFLQSPGSAVGRALAEPGDYPLTVQHEARAARPRHAGHDLPAARLLLGREPVVVVDQLPLEVQHVGFALPAGAAAAQVGGPDAYRLHGLEQAPLGG